ARPGGVHRREGTRSGLALARGEGGLSHRPREPVSRRIHGPRAHQARRRPRARGAPAAPARRAARAALSGRPRGEIPRQLRVRRLGARARRCMARGGAAGIRETDRPRTVQGMSMAGNRELEGRVALVTGASRNIGRAIALSLADAGASLVLSARTAKDEVEETANQVRAKGVKAVVQLADVTDEKAVGSLAKAAKDAFGRLDV